MKYIIGLVVLIAVATSLPTTELELTEQFESFTSTYNKVYGCQQERDYRYNTFKLNLDRIQKLNEGSRHATFGVNKFADMSEEEFKETYLNQPIPSDFAAQSCLAKGVSAPAPEKYMNIDLPDAFDWRNVNGKSFVSAVKDQGQCGSCWTFSTTGAIESAYAIKNKVAATLVLSEQAIVDCSKNCSNVDGQSVCNEGCNGGWPWAAVTDVIRWGGLPTESAYPYTAQDGSCQIVGKQLNAPPKSYTCLSGPDQQKGPADEKQLMPSVLMESGPLSIALNAGMFQFYISGVMDPFVPSVECSPYSLDHAVLIVGWGSETSMIWGEMPYWIVKNSWGTSWGENGYVRMYRGEGLCGLNAAVMSVAVK